MNDILSGLMNGQDSDASKRTIRNADAVLLLLDAMGGVAEVRDLRAALKEWRPGRSYGYLFQSNFEGSGYGFVGTSFHQTHNRISHAPAKWGGRCHESDRRTYYFRQGRGVYAISAEGYRRLGELEDLGFRRGSDAV
jgi:hypothetical protein